jgi:hypothetical protein
VSDKRAVAVTRKFLPWPSFLSYEDDDDFYSWYTGESMPSPEEITSREMEVIEMRLTSEESEKSIVNNHTLCSHCTT